MVGFKLKEKMRYVMMVPYFDINLPRRWALLAHEVGHILWNHISSDTKEKVLSELRKMIIRLTREPKDALYYVSMWERCWLPELFADGVGVSIGGVAYTMQFGNEVFCASPRSSWKYKDPYHPPPEVRIALQLEILKQSDVWKEEFEYLREEWKKFSHSALDEELSYPFDREILRFVNSAIIRITESVRVATKFWNDVIKLKQSLREGKIAFHGPLLVYAIGVLGPDWEPPYEIYEAIAAG